MLPPIVARCGATIELEGDRVHHKASQIRRLFRVPNPKYESAKRMGRALWGIKPYLCGFEATEAGGRVPGGALHILRNWASREGIPLAHVSARHSGETPNPLSPTITLRPYQIAARDALVRAADGVVTMPCGAGKTITALGAIGHAGTSALVLVHTKELMAQWVEGFHSILGVDVARLGAGTHAVGRYTVATVQTLTRPSKATREALGRRWGVVLLDEAHHAPATTFLGVLGQITAARRWGLTATPERADGLTAMMHWALGPVVYSITQAQLIEAGHLTRPTVVQVDSAFTYPYRDADDYRAMMQTIIDDVERNRLVGELAAEQAADGRMVLILTGRVAHAERLAAAAMAAGQPAVVLHGQLPINDRRERTAQMRRGEARIVVATTLADEGLDVPHLDCVILAYPTRSASRVAQRIGRIMRPHPDKRDGGLIFDVVDRRVGLLAGQARARRKVYAEVLGA